MTISGSDAGTSDQASSVQDTAREQAGRVGQTAADAGREVAGTTREQAGAVAEEAKQQARDLAAEARAQARQQADTQRDRLAQSVRSVSQELRSMADQGEQNGIASEIARQASDKAQDLARYLDERNPGDLVEEFRRLARRRPGTFLLGALAAGMVAGRLTRSAAGAAQSDRTSGVRTGTYDTYGATGTYGTGTYGDSSAETYPGATAAGTTAPVSRPDTLQDEPFAQPGSPRFAAADETYEPENVYPNSGGVRP